MSNCSLLRSILAAIGLLALAAPAAAGEEKTYPAPQRFEKAIAAFEAKDQQTPPVKGGVVCVGSSSMRAWHPTIARDLAPLTVLPRGFGGSNMNDALHYADRIVLRYEPRAILLYEGDNDIAQGVSPEKVWKTFNAFVKKVHERLPQTRIYVLAIKPSIRRWHLWPQMKRANELIAKECAKDKRLRYIDVATPMLDKAGRPKPEIFLDDKLHMNAKGYAIWRDAVRPVLVKLEAPLEKSSGAPAK